MDLEGLVGTQLAVGIPGTEATPDVINHLKSIRARSLVLFARNFTSPAQVKSLIGALETALGYRLLVMVDQEGGRVVRFKEGLTVFPSAQSMAEQTPEAVERQGNIEAAELRALGIAMNLAPCVDVLGENGDPVIGDRSYGADSSRVAAYACARIHGLQLRGMAACAKHFPGLGSVSKDPHVSLPTVSLDRKKMERADWRPFESAISAGVAAVMSSHVCCPGLEEPEGVPATFSPRLISHLLRQQMHFGGLILSDDLEMGALKVFGSMGSIARKAISAGHDVLLICSNFTYQKEAFNALCKAYREGDLGKASLQESVSRWEACAAEFLP